MVLDQDMMFFAFTLR